MSESENDANFDELVDSALEEEAPRPSTTGIATDTGTLPDESEVSDEEASDSSNPEDVASPVLLATYHAPFLLTVAQAATSGESPVPANAVADDFSSAILQAGEDKTETGTVESYPQSQPQLSTSNSTAPVTETPLAPRPTVATAIAPATPDLPVEVAETTEAASVLMEEPAGTEAEKSEKNTASISDSSIKMPITTTKGEEAPLKKSNTVSPEKSSEPPQVPQAVRDNPASDVVTATAAPLAAPEKSSSGTNRAEAQGMTSRADVFSAPTPALAVPTAAPSAHAASSQSAAREVVVLSSRSEFTEAIQKILDMPRELYPRRVEIQIQTPPGSTVTLSIIRTNGELRAQFDADNYQTLQWLNREIGTLQKMDFGLTVTWSPPQLTSEQQPERQSRERQERRRDGERRRNSTRTDATTGGEALFAALSSTKGNR